MVWLSAIYVSDIPYSLSLIHHSSRAYDAPICIMATPYKHRSLQNTRATRLLILKPAVISTKPLRCELLEISLDTAPAYEAVSYAWESQRPSSSILCNGHHLAITANCEAALRRFRKARVARILWVDSVCIDQAAIQERNHQVRIMDEIYAKASSVLIWLGPGNRHTDAVFDVLHPTALSPDYWRRRRKLHSLWKEAATRRYLAVELKEKRDFTAASQKLEKDARLFPSKSQVRSNTSRSMMQVFWRLQIVNSLRSLDTTASESSSQPSDNQNVVPPDMDDARDDPGAKTDVLLR